MDDDPLATMEVVVERHVDAPADQVWELLTDPPRMAAFSPEVVSAAWLGTPGLVGSRFEATNARGGMEWTVTCHVLEVERPTRFAWCVSDPQQRSSTWSYDLEPSGSGVVVRQRFHHGPGGSMVRRMVADEGADVAATVRWRSDMLRQDMADVLAAAAAVLEGRAVGS